jgi:tetratricopeptide (TPR) repeat protein
LATTFFSRGTAKSILKDNRGAITDYDEAIRLDPKYAPAFLYRGIAKRNLKDYIGAIPDYDEAIRLDPKYASAYSGRGWYSLSIGEFPNAIKDLSECINLDPKNTNGINNLSFLFSSCPDQSIRRPDRALELAKQAEQIEPADGYTLNALSCAYAAKSDFEKAIELQVKALQAEDWKKDDGISGGVLVQERLKKWRAKEQWSFTISQ